MFDCSKQILSFHDSRVSLPQKDQETLRKHRKTNQDKLKNALKDKEKPSPVKFVKQGSYAMRTMIQQPNKDWDIDDGVLFNKEDLVGPKGGAMSPLDARKMVRDIIDDGKFTKPPETKPNCVRVYYQEGHHVDIPVYRQYQKDQSTEYELASAEWKTSNPEGVTKWFEDKITTKEDEQKRVSQQIRRQIRLLKAFGISRDSWNLPSGFIWTVLTHEKYTTYEEKEDKCFKTLMQKILDRLKLEKQVAHPVVSGEYITKGPDDPRIKQAIEKLEWALEELEILDSGTCTKSKALKAWKKVFDTDYFDDDIKDAEEDEKKKATAVVMSSSPQPKQWLKK